MFILAENPVTHENGSWLSVISKWDYVLRPCTYCRFLNKWFSASKIEVTHIYFGHKLTRILWYSYTFLKRFCSIILHFRKIVRYYRRFITPVDALCPIKLRKKI